MPPTRERVPSERAERPTPLDGVARSLRLPLAVVMGAVPLVTAYLLAAKLGGWAAALGSVLLTPIFTPLLTPLCASLGLFRYHSRFLVSMPAWGGGMALHLGTGFDRIVHRRELGGWAGQAVRARVLASALDGLVAIAEHAESGLLKPETKLVATSYFFAPRTARSLGFEVVRPSLGDYVSFLLGWFDAMVWLSILHGRLKVPSPSSLLRVRTTARALATHLPQLRRLRSRQRRSGARQNR